MVFCVHGCLLKTWDLLQTKKTTGSHFQSTLFNTWSPLFSSCHFSTGWASRTLWFHHPEGRPATKKPAPGCRAMTCVDKVNCLAMLRHNSIYYRFYRGSWVEGRLSLLNDVQRCINQQRKHHRTHKMVWSLDAARVVLFGEIWHFVSWMISWMLLCWIDLLW